MFRDSSDDSTVEDELASILEANSDGILHPHDVVEYARAHPLSALHPKFDWDDSSAAEKFRLWQARCLIAKVVIRKTNESVPHRALVHIRNAPDKSDGYRPIEKVLSNKELFKSFDRQFRSDLKRLREKYSVIKHLHEQLFNQIDDLFNEGEEPDADDDPDAPPTP